MLAVKGRYNGSTVVFDSIPSYVELGIPIKECEVIVNFPNISAAERKNSLQQILKYRGQNIWEGDIEEMRSPKTV